jgi:hypothetical protein
MAMISYDDQTAAAYKAGREVPHAGPAARTQTRTSWLDLLVLR